MSHTPARVVPVAVTIEDGTIVCTPNPADILKDTSHVLLVFTLSADGFRFRTAKAIELDSPVDDFPFASWTISDTQAALFDRNQVADTFSYTVTLVNIKTGEELSVDPEIKNGGGGFGGGC